MLNSKQKGNLTELLCLAAFTELGFTVSIPYGDCAKYDFIVEIDGKLYKIQCKTSHLREEGVYTFQCSSTYINSQGNHRVAYDKNQVDFFCTFINGKCYLIPYDETGHREKVMRFVLPKNNQTKGITFADTYLAENQIERLKQE